MGNRKKINKNLVQNNFIGRIIFDVHKCDRKNYQNLTNLLAEQKSESSIHVHQVIIKEKAYAE